MTSKQMPCSVLEAAQDDLQDVISALIAADSNQLKNAQRSLEQMVTTIGSIEASCRIDPTTPVKEVLQDFRATLLSAGILSGNALRTIGHQSALAGLSPVPAHGAIQVDA